jgi:hypothetical protein
MRTTEIATFIGDGSEKNYQSCKLIALETFQMHLNYSPGTKLDNKSDKYKMLARFVLMCFYSPD